MHVARGADGHDQANGHFSRLCDYANAYVVTRCPSVHGTAYPNNGGIPIEHPTLSAGSLQCTLCSVERTGTS